MKKLCIALLMVVFGSTAQAHSYKQKAIQIGHAWSMPTDSSETQAYFPLLNSGDTEDRLISMSSPVAKSVIYVDRFGTEQKVLVLSSKMPVALRKGGAYLRLYGLKRALKDGDKIPLTLNFEKSGRVVIDLWIEPTPYAKPHQR
jgi:periplasmic copper chaperone A